MTEFIWTIFPALPPIAFLAYIAAVGWAARQMGSTPNLPDKILLTAASAFLAVVLYIFGLDLRDNLVTGETRLGDLIAISLGVPFSVVLGLLLVRTKRGRKFLIEFGRRCDFRPETETEARQMRIFLRVLLVILLVITAVAWPYWSG